MLVHPKTSFGTNIMRAAQKVVPRWILEGYEHALVLKKRNADGTQSEYAVDPKQVAQALGAEVAFTSGFITPDLLYLHERGVERVVAAYRKPQVTGLWLDGSDTALRVPLPGMVMIRKTKGLKSDYRIYAVKGRPMNLDAPLYAVPLPNATTSGVCWGTVGKTGTQVGNDLTGDWGQFLGSPFGSHYTNGKSKKHPTDIRKMLIALDGKKQYPLKDLRPAGLTLGDAIGRIL